MKLKVNEARRDSSDYNVNKPKRVYHNDRLNRDDKIPYNFISADFETVVHNNKHFVFCSSISYKSKGLNASPDGKIVSQVNYINYDKLNDDMSNIEELSNVMIIQFWNKLQMCKNDM